MHPMVNVLTAQLLPDPQQAAWLGVRYDFSLDLHHMYRVIDGCRRQAQGQKINTLNRLQRSLMKERVAAVSKDTTANLATFLSSAAATMVEYLNAGPTSLDSWKNACSLLRLLERYLERTVSLGTAANFDEAKFQAHLAHGTDVLQSRIQDAPGDRETLLLSGIMNQIKSDFTAGFKLSTGLSMGLLWKALRPIPFRDEAVLRSAVELEQLAARFDDLRWRTSASISDLCNAAATLDKAYALVKTASVSTEDLVKALTSEIEKLEEHIGIESPETKPFFSEDFERLRQISLLGSSGSASPNSQASRDLLMLSDVPTKKSMVIGDAGETAAPLQSISALACQGQYAWDGKFTTSLWSKLKNLGSVSLNSLALLETELPRLGRHLAALTADIVNDPLLKLNGILLQLLLEVFGAHGSNLRALAAEAYAEAVELASRGSAPVAGLFSLPSVTRLLDNIEAPHLREVATANFIPAIVSIAAAPYAADGLTHFSPLAWNHFSLGALKLYVPDRVFDPQIRPQMEREFFEDVQSHLDGKIQVLRAFEIGFTGQDTNARVELLQEEVMRLGPLPQAVQPVFRPETSELGRLHAEFSNILKAAESVDLPPGQQSLGSIFAPDQDQLQLVRENIQRLIDRLSTRYEAYQDMTQPTIGLLRCLLVGLSLCDAVSCHSVSSDTTQLLAAAPFLGGSPWDPSVSPSTAKNFEFLNLMSLAVAVDGIDNLESAPRDSIFECFHFFYNDWSTKLEADRKAEAANTSLYRFRGSAEDEEELDEEEFNELFPDYEGEVSGNSATSKRDQVRDTSVKVAQAHRKLFLSPQEPSTAISELCRAVAQRVADETEKHEYIDRSLNRKMLSADLVLLNEKMDMLTSPDVGKSYNFYVSENLAEARLLVSLANKIKQRFRELQQVDEIGHMQPLADVIMSCDKLLELTHTEPLAKILPKVEQLHAFVYEWQFGGWASRVHSVLELHNALTDTVIRWRRLELSTWAKLFDMEQKKCEEDASSWWFIAYQVVVAVPLVMVESASELRTYAVELIQNLELYFSTSIVGQFSSRLVLLRQLRNHLRVLVKDYPNLDIIQHSVTNFIDFYARYETTATETITKGRAPIDKKMKDVLLMASWKDTNINALRESARKSHQKLFRLVRKFRGVLGQEMKTIIKQGLPDEQVRDQSEQTHEGVVISDPDPAATKQLAQVLPTWLESNRRLANAPKTVSIMSRMAQSPELATDIPSTIDSFVSSLSNSMAELRKETPPFLTDDNKDQVKFLKTRKRKLFADTLKDLKQMGLRYNLSQHRLAEQESLAVALVSAAPIDFAQSAAIDASQYYLHKVLDMAPKIRDSARDHSEELTSAEMTRSIGFVEGMIHMLLSQRRRLSSASKAWSLLQRSVCQLRAIGDTKEKQSLSRSSARNNWSQVLPWLTQVINFAIQLVGMHGRLGETSHEDVVKRLQSWMEKFRDHCSKWQALGQLPDSITSSAHAEVETGISTDRQSFVAALDQMISGRPEIAFILDEVRRWSHVENVQLEPAQPTLDFAGFAGMVSRLCDKVLVATEAARKAGQDIPRNVEDPGWLSNHDDAFSLMVKQLHMRDVTRNIVNCVNTLEQVDMTSPGASLAVMGVANLATPILEQFTVMCRQSVSRLLDIHRATGHMAFQLTKTFAQISTEGFCTPQEKSDETSKDSGNVESGTGLGDGEGAEDISKDIQQDEDLTELAQEANKEEKGDIEDEKDAVDMADEELEGEMGSVNGEEEEEGSKNGDEEEEEKEMDEEAGDVDDLDPTAVDEKMWDGDDEDKADKDQQGDKSKGQKTDDEQLATEEESKQEEAEKDANQDEANEPDSEEAEAEQEDVKAQEELNKQEQTAQEDDALALPDDMELDFDDHESASSDDEEMNALSDVEEEQPPEEQEAGRDEEEEDAPGDSAAQEQEEEGMEEETKEEPEEEAPGGLEDEIQEDPKAEEEEEGLEESKDEAPPPNDNSTADKDNTAPSDVKSSGQDQSGEAMDLDDEFQDSAAQKEEGEMGQGADDQDAAAGNQGSTSQAKDQQDTQEQDQNKEESDATRSDPFKKLGDALERWHRQQSDIKEANSEDAAEQKNQPDADQGRREFEHLQNDDAAPDTQAMGTADDEEVQPIDEAMAIDEEKQDPTSRLMEEDKEEPAAEVPDQAEEREAAEAPEKESKDKDQDEARSGVQTRQGNYQRDQTPEEEEEVQMGDVDKDEDSTIEETSTQLETTHISSGQRELRDFGECMQQWGEFQSKTHGLSLSLTSQLRLILTPSQSTKLSGSFRTGKRLNIKRIIPYIASSYKRDKIWMRRAIPTKRTYQILLCVDDSRSMGDSSSGTLAMESLVMVSRSLTMLEAGQVGVVGFGSDVFTAHNLTDPFAADAGAKVLQNFSFAQDRTDIAQLIRQTIDTFRAARQQSAGNSDLWQLALILSDGLTPSSAHDEIRRLLREAMEERIMVVFIIMDDTGNKKGDSVLELKEAKFVSEGGESRVVIERYLDTFPFQYYLIVHQLEELPSALAGLLRTWFAEVSA